MKKALSTAALLALACISSAPHAQTRIDVVQVYERFFASRVAADRCGFVSTSDERKFLMNFMGVTIRALQVQKERHPTLSDGEVKSRMDDRAIWLRQHILSEVDRNGCSSPLIRQLTDLYEMHSEMDLDGFGQHRPGPPATMPDQVPTRR